MGLTVSNTTVTALGQRFVTKADTASSKSLGSATVPSDSGVAGTLGTWTEIITSTAAESYITAVGIVLTSGINATDFPVFIELGTGAAASEVVKWASVAPLVGTTATLGCTMLLTPPFRVTASKRVAARVSVNSAGNRNFTVHVYGLPISQTEGN
jgi:hypothetical protein